MATNGIRRKVDDLGRVVIPAGIRRSLNIREGDAVEVSVEGERVVLAKPRDACVFCGREDDTLQGFRGRLVCRDCVGTLGEVDDRLRAAEMADAAPDPSPSMSAPPAPPSPAPAGGGTWSTPAAPMTATASASARDHGREPTPTWSATTRRGPEQLETWADREGPIDGDHVGREARGVRGPHADPATDTRAEPVSPPADPATDTRPRRDPPPYDPASTTAW